MERQSHLESSSASSSTSPEAGYQKMHINLHVMDKYMLDYLEFQNISSTGASASALALSSRIGDLIIREEFHEALKIMQQDTRIGAKILKKNKNLAEKIQKLDV